MQNKTPKNKQKHKKPIKFHYTKTQKIENNFYVVNLTSSTKPLNTDSVPKNGIYKKRDIYLAETTISGKHWNRLRLGYFSRKDKAI